MTTCFEIIVYAKEVNTVPMNINYIYFFMTIQSARKVIFA